MMDLVIIGLFAFWVGRNLDSFDFDFSQNPQQPTSQNPQQPTSQTPQEDITPWTFTDWSLVREQVDAKSQGMVVYRLEKSDAVQNTGADKGKVLWTLYRILKNGDLFRSYSSNNDSLEQINAEFDEMVRPRTEAEQAEFEERQREKEEYNAEQNKEKEREREQTPSQSLNDPIRSKGGVM